MEQYDFRKRPVRRVNSGNVPFKAPARIVQKDQHPILFQGMATVVQRNLLDQHDRKFFVCKCAAQVQSVNGTRGNIVINIDRNPYQAEVMYFDYQMNEYERLALINTSSVSAALIALGCEGVEYNV